MIGLFGSSAMRYYSGYLVSVYDDNLQIVIRGHITTLIRDRGAIPLTDAFGNIRQSTLHRLLEDILYLVESTGALCTRSRRDTMIYFLIVELGEQLTTADYCRQADAAEGDLSYNYADNVTVPTQEDAREEGDTIIRFINSRVSQQFGITPLDFISTNQKLSACFQKKIDGPGSCYNFIFDGYYTSTMSSINEFP
jgi:hypothetical protein